MSLVPLNKKQKNLLLSIHMPLAMLSPRASRTIPSSRRARVSFSIFCVEHRLGGGLHLPWMLSSYLAAARRHPCQLAPSGASLPPSLVPVQCAPSSPLSAISAIGPVGPVPASLSAMLICIGVIFYAFCLNNDWKRHAP
jgi:hypothetical protein